MIPTSIGSHLGRGLKATVFQAGRSRSERGICETDRSLFTASENRLGLGA